MSIEERDGKIFECPANVDGDVLQVCGGGEYRIPIEFPEGASRTMRVLDIGANVGAFALFASRAWPGCEIHSYEPNPDALTYLRKNVATFALRATVHAAGVRAEPGRALLRRGIFGGVTNLCCASFKDVGAQAADGVEVEVIDASTLPDAHVVKIDTEGCELEIVDRFLATHKPPLVVLLEAHSRSDRVMLENLLDGKGLELFCGRLQNANVGTFTFIRRDLIREDLRAR